MNKFLYAIASILALTSCANTFDINGTTNVSTLDGQKLYLKVFKDTTLKNLDSCDVVHGQFQFEGSIDSVRVATIYLNETSGLPVVLEGGDIQVKIDNMQESVTGTPLNDALSAFRSKFTQLTNQSMELVHKHDQAIMNGSDMSVVNARLARENEEINAKMDKLVTSFVTENFDNVLGPYVFINTCVNRYEVPMLDAWIEDIMSKATDKFKNDPQVKEYYKAAQENQNIMNGMKDMPAQAPAQQVAPPQDGPTPNQMAACVCSGPSFVVLTVGQSLLGSTDLGVLLFLAQIFSGYLTAALLCRLSGGGSPEKAKTTAPIQTPPRLDAVLADSTLTYCRLCGFILFFRMLAAGAGQLLPAGAGTLCAMVLEVCSGCDLASRTGRWGSLLCCTALSVQGLSVLLQVRTICPPEMTLRPLYAARLLHLPLSLALFYMLLPGGETAAFSTLPPRVIPMLRVPVDCALLVFAGCCLAACSLNNALNRPEQKVAPARGCINSDSMV